MGITSLQTHPETRVESKTRRGALLLNLGTPDGPEVHHVRRYLKQFLMDPYVIDVPYLFRWLMVHGLILPKRPAVSAAAYQKIWTERGSPLLVHLKDLTQKVEKNLGEDWVVKSAMRYGEPAIQGTLAAFQEEAIQELVIFPLYPQYSLSATESCIQECAKILRKIRPSFSVRVVAPFFKHNSFIKPFVKVIEESLRGYTYDHLLLSFHGLPERHVKKLESGKSHCLASESCCAEVPSSNPNCYRAQCYVSARLIAGYLGLSQDRYTVCFQSRLGRTPWIKPYTDEFYRTLPQRGVKRLAVACPAFTADCLETLEEVQIRGKEEFIWHGGADLKLIPSLNSSDFWVNGVVQLLQDVNHSSKLSF